MSKYIHKYLKNVIWMTIVHYIFLATIFKREYRIALLHISFLSEVILLQINFESHF